MLKHVINNYQNINNVNEIILSSNNLNNFIDL